MSVSKEAKKVRFYKKDALPEAVAELLEIIRNFLFCGGLRAFLRGLLQDRLRSRILQRRQGFLAQPLRSLVRRGGGDGYRGVCYTLRLHDGVCINRSGPQWAAGGPQ